MWLKVPLLAAAAKSKEPIHNHASIQEQVFHLMMYERKKCSAMLFFGSIFGLLGFAFAFACGFSKFWNPLLSEYHENFPSGYGYFPAIVSEMVHNPQEPAGKCFFAFEFVGALFIFMSWYPWELRNVYTGDSAAIAPVPPLDKLSWSMFRQFIPPAGMMLVAIVTTTPFAQATALDYVCISIHLTGAVMLFLGYAVVEAHTLGYLCIRQSEVTAKTIPRKERRIRKLLLTGIFVFYFAFCVFTVVILLPLERFGGKNDVWALQEVRMPTGRTIMSMELVDTASGFVLGLKIASYCCEVFCGLCLIGSFLTIWYFCEERSSDLQDELMSVTEA